jgi:hypothetical protein
MLDEARLLTPTSYARKIRWIRGRAEDTNLCENALQAAGRIARNATNRREADVDQQVDAFARQQID